MPVANTQPIPTVESLPVLGQRLGAAVAVDQFLTANPKYASLRPVLLNDTDRQLLDVARTQVAATK